LCSKQRATDRPSITLHHEASLRTPSPHPSTIQELCVRGWWRDRLVNTRSTQRPIAVFPLTSRVSSHRPETHAHLGTQVHTSAVVSQPCLHQLQTSAQGPNQCSRSRPGLLRQIERHVLRRTQYVHFTSTSYHRQSPTSQAGSVTAQTPIVDPSAGGSTRIPRYERKRRFLGTGSRGLTRPSRSCIKIC
jgi:hypothetical protein